ncbi:TolC family protein [Undibacterium sp. Rencai35W]|uniref:TolC family protein n=1 Tax=Undibacterium sp. Rencai35W TaxID=3413046 RepID=UPI003BEF988C
MQNIFLSLALAGSVLSPAFSQTNQPISGLSLAAALDKATKNNPDIAMAMREVQAQVGAVRQAGILVNPELVALVEDTKKATRTTTLQLNQPIELGGKRVARMIAAELQHDASVIELSIKRSEISAAVLVNFYDVVITQERQRLAFSSTVLAQTATQAVVKKVTLGKVAALEETKARIAESTIQLEYVQASSELINARQRLATLLGGSLSDVEYINGQLSELPALPEMPELLASIGRAPVLLRARLEIERRLALSQIERTRRLPDLTLSVGTKRDEQLGRHQAILGIAIPIPLFDRNQGNLQEALSRTDKARDELTLTEGRVNSEVLQAYQRLSVAREETILIKNELIPGTQSTYEAVLKGYEFGKFSFLDVLDAQRTLLQTKSQYLRALSETHRAAAEIVRLTGDITLTSNRPVSQSMSLPTSQASPSTKF